MRRASAMARQDKRSVADFCLDFGPEVFKPIVEPLMDATKATNGIHPGFDIEQPLFIVLGPGADHKPSAGNIFQSNKIAVALEDVIPEDGIFETVRIDARAKGGGSPYRVRAA